jgi:acetyl esterase
LHRKPGMIPIRLYRSVNADGGWLLWIHGGGFMTGGLDAYDTLCRRLAHGPALAVISIDYRLHRSIPFPQRWTIASTSFDGSWKNPTLWGWIRSERRQRAGGNLATALVIVNRHSYHFPIRRQSLVYPAVDATLHLALMSQHGEG